MESIHPNVRYVWGTIVLIGAFLVGGVVAAIDSTFLHMGQWLAVVAASFAVGCGVPYVILRYRAWGFEVQEDSLYLEYGVLTKVESVVPFVRIQHVDTQRGPIERTAGLSSVVVYTAGTRGGDVEIPGLRPESARDLRDRLRDRAVESEEEAV